MLNRRFDQDAGKDIVFHWFLLCFNAGCINAGDFLATGKFVSHVTGFTTLFGASLLSNGVVAAFEILSVPFFFLLGALTSGILIDRRAYRGKKQSFDWAMFLCAISLALTAIGGEVFHFVIFGDTDINNTYLLMIFLCFACGLQNGAITSTSGSSVRTTHLTGLTTDLGLGIARLISYKRKTHEYRKELRANCLRFGSIASFVFGSALGSWLFLKMHFAGFFAPSLIAAYVALYSRRFRS